jgi:hypothetical protein
MVLPVRIELTTSPLPRECSTTELHQGNRAALRQSGDMIEPRGTGARRRVHPRSRHVRRTVPTDLSQLYVRNSVGQMVPLSTLGELRPMVGPVPIGLPAQRLKVFTLRLLHSLAGRLGDVGRQKECETGAVAPRPSLAAGRSDFSWSGEITGTPNGDAPSATEVSSGSTWYASTLMRPRNPVSPCPLDRVPSARIGSKQSTSANPSF